MSGQQSSRTSSSSSTSSATLSTAANASSFATNATFFSASATPSYPVNKDVFTATPKISAPVQAMSQAMQCWSDIATWRHQSASFWNANIAQRTWPISSSWSSSTLNWTRTKTIYPSHVSTYSLCDGTPRVNARPITTTITGTSTLWGSMTATLTPTFVPQPCTLKRSDCRILYDYTNIVEIDDLELLRQCGSPGHALNGAQCLLAGGPVEIIYSPVARDDTELCRSNNSTVSASPLYPGMSEITTLGRTFSSDSVYISFKTLFATYDGFWDTVGPTFTDHIVALHSTDLSTQCGGWHAAYGPGTALNYADLNWPVPASAYKCQDRCAMKMESSAFLGPYAAMWSMWLAPTAPQCSTIWSDINPIIALPTKIRDMVPEWSSCSLYDDFLANFWFDPPIALQPQEAVAMPTLASSVTPQSTSAAPASTPNRPGPENTQAASASTLQTFTTRTSIRTAESSPSSAGDLPLPLTPVRGHSETTAESSVSRETTSSGDTDAARPGPENSPTVGGTMRFSPLTSESKATFSFDSGPSKTSFAYDPSPASELVPFNSAQSGVNAATFSFDATSTQIVAFSELPQPQSSLDPAIATVAAFSILTQALATFQENIPTTTAFPGILVTSSRHKITVTLTSSKTITDIDPYVNPSTSSDDPAGGSTTPPSSQPKPTLTRTEYVIAPGSFTLPATAVIGNSEAIQVGTAILSVGGPAATVNGQVLTKAPSGVVLVPSGADVLAAGHYTVTAVILPGNHTAYDVGGTTLSMGGSAAVIQNATFTVGPGGLGMIRSQTTKLPSVIPPKTATSTRSRWSSAASSVPTATPSGCDRTYLDWIHVVFVAGTLACLLCM